MSATLTNITDADFQQEVLNSDLPVVVDFWAPWCGPCRMVAPVLETLGAELEGKVRIVKVNVDENQEQAGSLGVQGIPALLFFQGGQLVHRVTGALPEENLRKEVKKAFNLD